MNPGLGHWRWPLVAFAAVVVATGGVAYASIPDAGGVIHTCYTKASGAVRVIDTDAGQACKSNEAALDLYSKGGADLAFLGKTQKASDSDELDGLDSTSFLGATAKAADSNKLDGLDSTAFLEANAKAADSEQLDGVDSIRYLRGLFGRLLTDFKSFGDNAVFTFGVEPEGFLPGILFDFDCQTDGSSTLTVRSDVRLDWWWDATFGSAVVGPPYVVEFAIGAGVENHAFRGGSSLTTTLDLDTHIDASGCAVGWTLLSSGQDSPGP